MMPSVKGEEAYWGIKQTAIEQQHLSDEPAYEAIELPRNTPTGIITAFFATLCGFALIWHIWWMVVIGLLGAFATFVAFAWRDHADFELPAAEVRRVDLAKLSWNGATS